MSPQYRSAFQSMLILYSVCNAASKCSASSLFVYLMAKSSTTNRKDISLVLCFHKPAVCGTGAYPNGSKC